MINMIKKVENIRGIIKYNEPMAVHTSWHIGGPADCYFQPADLNDLILFLQQFYLLNSTHSSITTSNQIEGNHYEGNHSKSITWLGLGSNVLIADQGIRGTVIHTQGTLGKIELIEEHPASHSQLIRVEAGVPCAKIAKWCAKQGLTGGAFFAGIPGTLGGALVMNAGAFGGETWNHVEKVEVINDSGDIFTRVPSNYEIGYRTVKLKKNGRANNLKHSTLGNTAANIAANSTLLNHPTFKHSEWFIAAHLRFPKGDGKKTEAEIKALLRKRNDSQPIGVFSCGSVFKNPLPQHAARLIEESGLKGYKMGDAQISPKHSNFIINLGNATAENVLELIKLIQDTIWKNYQIKLQTEVKMLGF